MAYTPSWQRLCDCRCIIHHQLPRTTYRESDCACTITCATQPLALLAEPRSRAWFLDRYDTVRHVPAMANGTWDWAYAATIGTRSDHPHTSRAIEDLLRRAGHLFTHLPPRP
ncbi:hypothetical protein [Micromonospora antibiotica]|uniref:Uncharacterized protein n=1 Tax=Micromonospora antibiotica TaxID=2807623 RepID=A0ABS3V732_9ACTN|nr:hypothetical protein [Micromonospora antibiotica]MBO4161384.1 hypothetical protein [Micromonospora antibiotica]